MFNNADKFEIVEGALIGTLNGEVVFNDSVDGIVGDRVRLQLVSGVDVCGVNQLYNMRKSEVDRRASVRLAYEKEQKKILAAEKKAKKRITN